MQHALINFAITIGLWLLCINGLFAVVRVIMKICILIGDWRTDHASKP